MILYVMNAVEASDLCKRFGEVVAVNGVGFNMREGEILGLLGPNGAGKTTTIRMLTGILKPDRGEARIMGFDVFSDPVKARMLLGVVPEEANPYPDLSAWDNLVLIGRLYGLPRGTVEERAHNLLSLLELYDVRDRKAKHFSKGMKQKLLVAMALIGEPKVLFLDEPTAGLDVFSARRIRGLILDLKKKGVAILLTTHNVEEAGSLCDRIAIMSYGRIVENGSPEELRIKSGLYTYVSATFDKAMDERDVERFFNAWEHRVQGSKLTVICREPAAPVIKVVEYAETRSLNIISIRTSPPNLEEIFVKVVRGNDT